MFPARLFQPGFSSVRLLCFGIAAFGALNGAVPRAFANDGGISMGGTPRLLSGHPSVTMTNEVINIVVEKDKYTVDCRFTFINHGPDCIVRMGFPDEGYGANDPDEEEDPKTVHTKSPHTTFTSFRSYVEGEPVTTELIRGNEEGHYWHTKMVRFPAHSTRHIRDVYTQRTGGGIIVLKGGKSGNAAQVAYTLHTGSSWHGNIGRTEINVTFRPDAMVQTPQLVSLSAVAKTDARDLRVDSIDRNAIVWKGPCAPKVQENTLHFIRANWRPTQKDDLELTYNYAIMKASR